VNYADKPAGVIAEKPRQRKAFKRAIATMSA